MKYEVNDLSSDDLKKIESQIRMIMGELFSGCHRRYLDGVNQLDSYFYEKFNQKVILD